MKIYTMDSIKIFAVCIMESMRRKITVGVARVGNALTIPIFILDLIIRFSFHLKT